MPTERHGKVKHMLRSGEAKVVRRVPFTIRLTRPSKEFTQPIALGIDAGSKTVGISAATEQQELFSAELKPRNDVKTLLKDRGAYRHNRRYRKHRFRPARFNNRTHSKPKGWVAPSVKVKIHNHIQGINLACKILPITSIVIETAEFDTQRLKAMLEGKPLPVGTDYQLGEQYDYYNVRQYVLRRDGYKCAICGHEHGKIRKGSEAKFHVHHIESRRIGGNAPNNLITLCKACHKKYHEGKQPLPKRIRKPIPMRDAVFMGIMRKALIAQAKAMFPDIEVSETHGYITKYRRETAKLQKSHAIDARCVTGYPTAEPLDCIYHIKPVRAHNRSLHADTVQKGGYRESRMGPKYVFGFQMHDRVRFVPDGREGFISARKATGVMALKKIGDAKPFTERTYKKLIRLENRKSLLIERHVTT
jgi:N6-L-threonylcarbamoyladenine synthase